MKNTIAESMQRNYVRYCVSQSSIRVELQTAIIPLRHSPTMSFRKKHMQQYKHRQPYDTLMNDKTDCSNITSRYLLTDEKQKNLSGLMNALLTHTYKDTQYLRQRGAFCPLGYIGTRVYAHINCVPSSTLYLFLMHENEFTNHGILIFHLSRYVQKYNSKYFQNNINPISQPSRAKLAQLHKLASNSQGCKQVDTNWYSCQETQPDFSSTENSTTNTDLDKNRDMSPINSAEMLGLNEHRDMSPINSAEMLGLNENRDMSPINSAEILGLNEHRDMSPINSAEMLGLNEHRDMSPINSAEMLGLNEHRDMSPINSAEMLDLNEHRDMSPINSAEMLGLNEHRDMSPINISPANNSTNLSSDEYFKLSAIKNAIAFDLDRFRDVLPIKNETLTELEERYDRSVINNETTTELAEHYDSLVIINEPTIELEELYDLSAKDNEITTELTEQYDLPVSNNENASNLIERDYSGGVDLHRIRVKETLESISSDMEQKLKKNSVIPVSGKCISPLYLDLPTVNIDLTVVPVHLITFEPLLTILSKISDGQTPPPHVTMRYELLRLCTFRTYPRGDKPFFLRFAAAGFYYAAKGDEVVCYCCAIRKSNWTGDQVPMDIHRNSTPTCSFLIKNSEVNVSVLKSQTPSDNRLQLLENESSSSTRLNASTSNQQAFVRTPTTISEVTHSSTNLVSRTHQTDQPVRMSRDNNLVNYSNVEASPSLAHLQQNVQQSPSLAHLQQNVQQSPSNQHVLQNSSPTEAASDAGTFPLPKHSKFSTKVSRSKSYNGCTSTFVVPVDALSEAGFFYAGFGDCVRCFYCGIGLRNWTPEDDPWIEHARWSKNCQYVKQMKGKEYVNLVQLAVQYTQNGESSSNEESKSPSARKTAEANINFARSPTQDDTQVQNQNTSTQEEMTARQSSATTTAMRKPTNSSGEFKHSHKKNLKLQQQKLLQENERLKQQSICTECKRNGVCIVFLPCGHLITCEQCAPKVKHCSICQTIVKGTVRTYFS